MRSCRILRHARFSVALADRNLASDLEREGPERADSGPSAIAQQWHECANNGRTRVPRMSARSLTFALLMTALPEAQRSVLAFRFVRSSVHAAPTAASPPSRGGSRPSGALGGWGQAIEISM